MATVSTKNTVIYMIDRFLMMCPEISTGQKRGWIHA